MTYPVTGKYNEKGFAPPLKPGHYVVKLVSVKETDKEGMFLTFKKDGTKYNNFEFKVKDWPENKLFERLSFDEEYEFANAQLGKFKQMLMAMRVNTDNEGDLQDLVGKVVKVEVVNKEWQGTIYNNIREYFVLDEPVDFDEPEKAEDDDLPFA